MRFFAASVCLLALTLTGCDHSSRSVYVDVAALVSEEPTSVDQKVEPQKPPQPMPAMDFSMAAQQERVVKDAGGQIKTSIAEIEATQKSAIQALNRRLRTLYAGEIAHFTRDLLSKFEGDRSKAYSVANDAIRAQFLEYGAERGPLLAQLAVATGWPDPNPTSKGDSTTMRVVQRKLFEKSKRLREEIAALDKEFAAKADTLVATAEGASKEELLKVQQEVDDFRVTLNAKADAEAAKQVRATPKELDIRLAGARSTVLQAIPAQTVQIPASAPMPPAPQVTFSGIEIRRVDRKRRLEEELHIWLGLNHFTLAERGQGSPDVTKEFKAWRKTFLSVGH